MSDRFSGSKALAIGAQEQFFEPIDAYRFAFPNMSLTIAGEPADDYGRQDDALSGRLESVSYGGIYGWDNGEVNAILKLIASHFDRVYSVDIRSYETDMGQPFRMAEYLRAHEITKVLLVGNTTFFTTDETILED